jgi:hypothetical protein
MFDQRVALVRRSVIKLKSKRIEMCSADPKRHEKTHDGVEQLRKLAYVARADAAMGFKIAPSRFRCPMRVSPIPAGRKHERRIYHCQSRLMR